MRPSRHAAIPALLAVVAVAHAGSLVTTDGQTYTGTIKRADEGWSVTQTDGSVVTVPARKVKTIELGGDDNGKPGREAAGLQSLRRSVEFSDDLPRIVQRYKAFVAATKDVEVVKQAEADLAIWQTRLDSGYVKAGKNWVTPAERDALARAYRKQAELARLLIKDNRDRDAQKVVDAVEADDPQNVSALYLDGVLAQRHKDLNEAKKNFLAVQQALPQHPPTLLNLALIDFRQKQWAAANVAMDQALQAAPVTQVLLDTAVEFINATPPELRKTRTAQQLAKTFLAQDAELQKRLAAQHLHRWGSSWIDDAAYEKVKAVADESQKKLADLQKQFDDANARITSAQQRVSANEESMRTIEASSYTRLTNGQVVRVPLPRAWYDLQAENLTLNMQIDQDKASIATIQADARQTRDRQPAPAYTGVLTPIGEDGVPLTVLPDDAPPASQPAGPPPPTSLPATQPNVVRVGPPDGVAPDTPNDAGN